MFHGLMNNPVYCHMHRVRLQMGFGLIIAITEHLQIVITCNYSAIANSHTLQFITARSKSFQSAVSSPVVAW
jgi:hypothetical protein